MKPWLKLYCVELSLGAKDAMTVVINIPLLFLDLACACLILGLLPFSPLFVPLSLFCCRRKINTDYSWNQLKNRDWLGRFINHE